MGVARAEPAPGPTPQAACGAGSLPETDIQGRVPASDYDDGRVEAGYTCNAALVGHEGGSGGFRVHRYVDAAGHECAYYDTSMIAGLSLLLSGDAGVAVLDMSDPSHPVRTTTLRTPAMLSPHESLSLNERRGLLAAIMGSPATAPGVVDIYDLTADCRYPALKSSSPVGVAGHEATFAPDGKTLYTTATGLPWVMALDVSHPAVPVPLWVMTSALVHGMNVSDDGTRLYGAVIASAGDPRIKTGLGIWDVSQVQNRVPNPTVPLVSALTWPNVSVPQTAIPITVSGHPYLVEIDEYAGTASSAPSAPVGAGRIIDIADDTAPFVLSNLRLKVNEPDARTGPQADDPGADNPGQGYAGHYCAVPKRTDPGIVACSFIISGLRVFDIHDPSRPAEVAYFNPPARSIGGAPAAAVASADATPGLFVCRIVTTAGLRSVGGETASAASSNPLADLTDKLSMGVIKGSFLSYYAMSAPAFVPERNEIWYSDGLSGFYAMRLTDGAWASTAAASPTAAVVGEQASGAAGSSGEAVGASAEVASSSATDVVSAAPDASPAGSARDVLARTGQPLPLALAAAAIAVGLLARRGRRGARSS
jgi:hypothetical protein